MKFTSIIAIYFLCFVASAFMLLPFGVKTSEEMGVEKVPGQADSAPVKFDVKRHLLKAAVLALTQAYTDALARAIREHPDEYFWPHRRWKSTSSPPTS